MKFALLPIFLCLSYQFGQTQNTVISFDGIDDYVDLGVEIGNDIRTIECWFRLSKEITPQLEDFSTLLAREISGTNGNTDEFSFSFQPNFVNNPGTLRFDIDGTLPFKSVYSNNNNWNANQWYHVAVVIHPENGMSLFIDGIKQSSTHPHTEATTFSTDITTIGCWGKAFFRYFEGEIDDLRISSEALYSSNFIPICPDLTTNPSDIGLWNFNEDSGELAIDSSGNSHHGLVVGASRLTTNICRNSTTNTSNINANLDIDIYPNPSDNSFKFDFQNINVNTATIIIFNPVGKHVLTQKGTGNSLEVNLLNHPPGIYFYLIKINSSFLSSGRIVKI